MKVIKRIIVCSLAVTLSLSGSVIVSNESETPCGRVFAEEAKTNEWEYKIYDKIDGISSVPCVEITKYCGNDDIAYIPDQIEKYPVVSVAGKPFANAEKTNKISIPSSIKRFEDGFLENSNIHFFIYDDDSTFSIEEGKKLTLIKYNGFKANVEVPDSIAGYTVTALGDYAFLGNTTIKSVTLPDAVDYFGRTVFSDSSLEEINIPESLKIIPSKTFEGCNNLKNIEWNNDAIIAYRAFSNTPVTLPESALSYETKYCDNSFADIIIDKGVLNFTICYDKNNRSYSVKINSYNPLNDPLISDSNKKTDIDIPEQIFNFPVTEIGNAFWRNGSQSGISLSSITFPSGIKTIGFDDLYNPSDLKSVTIKAKDAVILSNTFRNTGIEELTLQGSCRIGESAFSGCKNLKKIVVSGEAENINISAKAFHGCTALETINFPDNSDIKINSLAFGNCSSLKKIAVNGNVSVSANAFKECVDLSEISISGNADLSSNAFIDDKSLTDICVNTNNAINGSAFNGCSNLMSVNSITAFDSEKDELAPELKSFILNNFNGSENVGFVNLYIKSQADKVVSEYTDSSMSDIQKVKILHDWICNKVVFEYDNINAPETQNDGSVFMNDSTICEGYAKGYNLLLNAAGIESVYVHSSNHAWNIIKLGNQYFHSDTTWDDGDTISYNWFLKSDSEISAETTSHSNWSLLNLSPLHNSTDVLPECKYSMGDLNTDGKISVADLVILNSHILGKTQLDSDNYILSDLNFDGITDSFDMVCMRKLLINN